MKRIIILIVIASLQLASTSLWAQDNGLDNNAKQIEDCVLWKIQGLYSKPSYVFAKIPGLCQEDLIMTDATQIGLYDADELILEVDHSSEELTKEWDKSNQLPKGKTLQSYFKNEKDYAQFQEKITAKFGDKSKAMLQLKPMALLHQLYFSDLTCENKISFDDEFTKIAVEQKKTISGLETIAEHAKIFDKVTNEDYAAMLMQAIDGKKATQQAIELFKKWNIKALLAMKMKQDAYKNNPTDLIYYRNKKWANDLKSKINNKSCFIVVDAANVTGENGLLMTLLFAGFSFEPVMQ